MVAPNGARLTKSDHLTLPMSIPEIIAAARDCVRAGADGLHAHVRDPDGHHVLDAGLYRELLDELALTLPGLYVQITTESVGLYAPKQQRALVEQVQPPAVSVALREITSGEDAADTKRFFSFCQDAGVEVQHILYDLEDIARFGHLRAQGVIPDSPVLIVLGQYGGREAALPADLVAPVRALLDLVPDIDWAVCAFGARETECLLDADRLGGKMRIGFENNLIMSDGSVAQDNAARVSELVGCLRTQKQRGGTQ